LASVRVLRFENRGPFTSWPLPPVPSGLGGGDKRRGVPRRIEASWTEEKGKFGTCRSGSPTAEISPPPSRPSCPCHHEGTRAGTLPPFFSLRRRGGGKFSGKGGSPSFSLFFPLFFFLVKMGRGGKPKKKIDSRPFTGVTSKVGSKFLPRV
jgi:hypothetical protein